MLKINLLPTYINDVRKSRVAVVLAVVLIALEVGGFMVAKGNWTRPIPDLEKQKASLTTQKTDLTALKTEAAAIDAQTAKFGPKLDFINNVAEFNKAYTKLYRTVSDYTYRSIMVLAMSTSANRFTTQIYASSLPDLSRFTLYAHNNPVFTENSISLSGIRGYEPEKTTTSGGGSGNDIPGSSVLGGLASGGGPGGGAGMPNYAGMAGMAGGGPGGGAMDPIAAGMPAAGSGAGSGGAPGYMGIGGPSGGAYGGMGGSFGGGSSSSKPSNSLGAIDLTGARKELQGYQVTMTAQLVQPISRPNYGSSASQARSRGGRGGGGGGAYGGMMGAMSGGGGSGGAPAYMGITGPGGGGGGAGAPGSYPAP